MMLLIWPLSLRNLLLMLLVGFPLLMRLMVAEFAYGGFFKGASSSIYGGDSEIDLVAGVVIVNVVSLVI